MPPFSLYLLLKPNSEGGGIATNRGHLLATGLGEPGSGGAFLLNGGQVERIDELSTTGVAVSADGAMLARLLWNDQDTELAGELMIYDAMGLVVYRRIEDLREAHGVVWHEGRWVAVSTLRNSLLWLDASGNTVCCHAAPGVGDCWHLNNLLVHEGRLLACAFGRFEEHRGWSDRSARVGRGVVFDLADGRDVLSGLTCPHDPCALDGGWLVCNSASEELLRCDLEGAVVERCALGGWTRGLAYDEERIYVGVSAHRELGLEGTASVAVLDRGTLQELDRWMLPCREVFSLVFVPGALVEGLRAGVSISRGVVQGADEPAAVAV
jgi:hypothetical protein